MPLEEFMEQVYNKYVPNIYVPEPSVMSEVIKHVDLNGAIEHVPRLWSDMIIFDHSSRQNLVEAILNVMINNEPEQGSEFTERFAYIAWDIHNRIRNQNDRRLKKIG